MAIVGSATSAHLCSLDRDGNLITKETTTTKDFHFSPDYAVTELFNRKLVIVAGANMVEFRKLVAQFATGKAEGNHATPRQTTQDLPA